MHRRILSWGIWLGCYFMGLAVANAQPIEVFSVVGKVLSGGQQVQAGQRLSAGAQVQILPQAMVQLLLKDELLVTAVGLVNLRLLDSQADVVLLQGEKLRLGGRRGTLLVDNWRVEILPPGGTFYFDHFNVQVLEGKCRLTPPLSKLDDSSISPTSAPTSTTQPTKLSTEARYTEISEGASAELSLDGTVQLSKSRGVAGFEESSRYAPPAAWIPTPYNITLTEARQAELRSQREQAEREASSCGCTESNGSSQNGSMGSTGGNSSGVERQLTKVRIKVTGVPRKL